VGRPDHETSEKWRSRRDTTRTPRARLADVSDDLPHADDAFDAFDAFGADGADADADGSTEPQNADQHGLPAADRPTRDDLRAAEVFAAHRRLLISVAYRVLGRHADAEDVVQEAWLRWSGTDAANNSTYVSVDDPKAFLVTVVTRLAIDQLRKAQTRKEAYVGPWLPEPVLTDAAAGVGVGLGSAAAVGAADAADRVVLDDTVSLAMLLVMETLSPLERAVFVLREAFDYSFAEIATMLERTEPAVRQLLVRARNHVQDKRPRYPLDDASRRSIADRFLSACTGGDIKPLLELLAPDVVMTADGGGVVNMARRPVEGADEVARFLLGIARLFAKFVAEGVDYQLLPSPVGVNGSPALVALLDGRVWAVYTLELDAEGRITDILGVGNPAKLDAVQRLADMV
jgi:RNA polymerase sigma-70 factor (ECF subfamily)